MDFTFAKLTGRYFFWSYLNIYCENIVLNLRSFQTRSNVKLWHKWLHKGLTSRGNLGWRPSCSDLFIKNTKRYWWILVYISHRKNFFLWKSMLYFNFWKWPGLKFVQKSTLVMSLMFQVSGRHGNLLKILNETSFCWMIV